MQIIEIEEIIETPCVRDIFIIFLNSFNYDRILCLNNYGDVKLKNIIYRWFHLFYIDYLLNYVYGELNAYEEDIFKEDLENQINELKVDTSRIDEIEEFNILINNLQKKLDLIYYMNIYNNIVFFNDNFFDLSID